MPIVRELEHGEGPRVSSPGISHLVAEQRIRSACLRLGLGFTDAVALVDFDPDADSA